MRQKGVLSRRKKYSKETIQKADMDCDPRIPVFNFRDTAPLWSLSFRGWHDEEFSLGCWAAFVLGERRRWTNVVLQGREGVGWIGWTLNFNDPFWNLVASYSVVILIRGKCRKASTGSGNPRYAPGCQGVPCSTHCSSSRPLFGHPPFLAIIICGQFLCSTYLWRQSAERRRILGEEVFV